MTHSILIALAVFTFFLRIVAELVPSPPVWRAALTGLGLMLFAGSFAVSG